MKQLVYTAVVLLATGLAGCKKLIQFHMDYDNSVTIPANAIVELPIDLLTPETVTDSEQQFGNNGTSSNLISRISLTDLTLRIQNPESETFNFLKNIQIYLRAPEMPEVLVAYADPVPATGLRELALTCEDVDLKDYLRKSSYSIRVKATSDEALVQDTQVNIHSRFAVDAGIF